MYDRRYDQYAQLVCLAEDFLSEARGDGSELGVVILYNTLHFLVHEKLKVIEKLRNLRYCRHLEKTENSPSIEELKKSFVSASLKYRAINPPYPADFEVMSYAVGSEVMLYAMEPAVHGRDEYSTSVPVCEGRYTLMFYRWYINFHRHRFS